MVTPMLGIVLVERVDDLEHRRFLRLVPDAEGDLVLQCPASAGGPIAGIDHRARDAAAGERCRGHRTCQAEE
jgi:hypothetical protein